MRTTIARAFDARSQSSPSDTWHESPDAPSSSADTADYEYEIFVKRMSRVEHGRIAA
jgi:hypothetical protein